MSQQTKDQLRKSLRKIVFQVWKPFPFSKMLQIGIYFLCIVIPTTSVAAVVVAKVNSEGTNSHKSLSRSNCSHNPFFNVPNLL